MSHWWSCCGSICGCSGTVPDEIQIDITGIIDDVCTDCDEEISGSFVATKTYESEFLCEWRYYYTGSPCNMHHIRMGTVATGTYVQLYVQIWFGTLRPTYWRWLKNLTGESINCAGLSGEVLGWYPIAWPPVYLRCDYDGTFECKVTAL